MRYAPNLRIFRFSISWQFPEVTSCYYGDYQPEETSYIAASSFNAESSTRDLARRIFGEFPALSAVIIRVCEWKSDYSSYYEWPYVRSRDVGPHFSIFDAIGMDILKDHVAYDDFMDCKYLGDDYNKKQIFRSK